MRNIVLHSKYTLLYFYTFVLAVFLFRRPKTLTGSKRIFDLELLWYIDPFASCSIARSHGSLLAFKDKPHKHSHEVITAPTLTQSTPICSFSLVTTSSTNEFYPNLAHFRHLKHRHFLCAIYPLILMFLFLSYYFTFLPLCLQALFWLFLPFLTIPFSAFLSLLFHHGNV